MRMTMTSPILRRRRLGDRCWQPRSRLVELLGASLTADCQAAMLPEANGIGTAPGRLGPALNLARSSPTRWLSTVDGCVKALPPDGWRCEAGIFASATNLCLQSEGLASSPWTSQNGASAAVDATTPGPLPTVFKITNAGTALGSALRQTLSGMTDGQPHTAAVYVRPGTVTGFSVGLYDATVATWRGQSRFDIVGGRVVWNSTAAGSYLLEKVPQSDWYRVTVRAPSVVAANSNRVYLYTSNPSVLEAGTIFMTGVQVQLGVLAQPYIPTTGAANSRSADQVTVAASALAPAFTVGLVTRILDHGGSPSLAHLPGTAGDNNRMDLSVSPTAGLIVTLYDSGGTAKTWTQNGAPTDRETARWVISNDNAGTVRAWKNEVELTLTPAGAGSGVRNGLSAQLQLGQRAMGNLLQGQLWAWLHFGRALDGAQCAHLQAALRRLGS